MTNPTLEKAARALARLNGDETEAEWPDWVPDAAAALSSALHDPSDEVVRAYWDGYMAARMADPMMSELDAICASLCAAGVKITGRDT